ncbi:MAG: zinc-binding dehydrogenase, partial [Actinomycetota bacterium]|nr:zinc-binding dehydrogenase [Actinomycetota bacterium]
SLSYGADVVGVEPIAGRRRLAEVAGAVAVEAEPQAVRQALGDRPPHVVVACTGAPGALELAFELAGPATTVQLFAPSGLGARLPVEVNRLFFEEITVQASYSAGPADTRIALELLGRGQVSAEGLITHRFPLSRTGEALRAAKSAPGVVKVVVEGTG